MQKSSLPLCALPNSCHEDDNEEENEEEDNEENEEEDEEFILDRCIGACVVAPLGNVCWGISPHFAGVSIACTTFVMHRPPSGAEGANGG